MIVKLGKENEIDIKENEKITNLIKGLTHTIFSDNKSLCDNEFKIIQDIYNKSGIYLKNYLNLVLQKMFNIGFDYENFLSDDKNEMGNIGTKDPKKKFEYILTNEATIREKVNSLFNTFFDSIEKKPKQYNINLINFIFTYNSAWNKQRIEQLKKITNKNTFQKVYKYIIKNKLFDLWAPIIYIS